MDGIIVMRVGKWPTLLLEAGKVADTIFLRVRKLSTVNC